ncbi:MAG: HEAT repeat domain-containing protein [Candidatus Glassbacteria bacterium]
MILAVLLFRAGVLPAASPDVGRLVAEAARPEVIYADPARADSLIGEITKDPAGSLPHLLALVETPWALQFDIVRRCLERIGEPARLTVEKELEGTPTARRTALLLVVLEKIGGPGRESLLARYAASAEPALVVTSLRCLAAFGEPTVSTSIATPLLSHPLPQVRLAAAWTLGEICRRQESPSLPEEALAGLRSLLADNEPRIRLTAEETLAAASVGKK